jgi:tetratricopeptide (TPR) repeat protein
MYRTLATITTVVLLTMLVNSCAKKTPEEKLQEAAESLQKRDPLGAIVLAHEVLRENTTGTLALQARWLLFQCYSADRNIKECRRVLNEIIDQVGLRQPEGQNAAAMKIQTYSVVGQTTEALVQTVNFLQAATPGSPFWADLSLARGNFLRSLNQATSAAKVLGLVLTNKQVTDSNRWQALGALEACYGTTATANAGIEFLQAYLDDQPSTNIVPDVYMVMGPLAEVLKQKERADAFYNKGFEAFSHLFDTVSGAENKIAILLRYGQAHYFKGDLEQATTLVQKALKDYPTSPRRIELFYRLAQMYAGKEKYDKAIEVCRQIPQEFANDPRRVQALFMIAEMHARQRKWDDAVKDLQEITVLFPGTDVAQRAGMALRQVETLKRKEAETSATLAAAQITSGTVKLPSGISVSTPPLGGMRPGLLPTPATGGPAFPAPRAVISPTSGTAGPTLPPR